MAVIVVCVLRFIFPGSICGFVHPLLSTYAVLAGLMTWYLVLVEIVKKWFYRRCSSW